MYTNVRSQWKVNFQDQSFLVAYTLFFWDILNRKQIFLTYYQNKI